jgi:nitrite reductase (NADH) large subunit
LNLTRYLAGELTRDELTLHSAEWYAENNITLMRDVEATGIDLPRKYMILSNGDVLTFDTLILATGSEPVMPPFPGVDRANVTALRTIDDADRLILACGQGKKFVCVGGGMLGLEAAGALASRGEDVTVVEVMPWLMPRQLNRRAAELFQENIQTIGIKLYAGVKVKEITGNRTVDGVTLDNGTNLPADVVVISAGVKVDTEIIKEAGIKTNNGIVVDAAMKTDHPFVYAAGDAAEFNGAMYGTWGPSQGQGTIAGMNASGSKADFSAIPRSNTLKVLGINLFSIGTVNPMPEGAVLIEEMSAGHYTGLVFIGEVLVGGLLLGDTTLSTLIKKAVEGMKVIPQKTIRAGVLAVLDFLKT